MEQAFKSMMTQSPSGSFGSNSPFPFAMPPQAAPTKPSSYPYSEPKKDTSPWAATVDVSATEVEAAGASKEDDVAETPKTAKKFCMAFMFVVFFPLIIVEWKVRPSHVALACSAYIPVVVLFFSVLEFLAPLLVKKSRN